jgi:hypothetical protein
MPDWIVFFTSPWISKKRSAGQSPPIPWWGRRWL